MKDGVLSVIYGAVALFSVLLMVLYFIFDKQKKPLFLALFCCVATSNLGYFLLSICSSLAVAKLANTISYFGGVFSMLVMVLIIYDVYQMRKRKWLTWSDSPKNKQLLKSYIGNGLCAVPFLLFYPSFCSF